MTWEEPFDPFAGEPVRKGVEPACDRGEEDEAFRASLEAENRGLQPQRELPAKPAILTSET